MWSASGSMGNREIRREYQIDSALACLSSRCQMDFWCGDRHCNNMDVGFCRLAWHGLRGAPGESHRSTTEADVRLRWRRFLLAIILACTALVVAIVLVAVDRGTREGPNYSWIEDGLWLGGSVAKPPPGTHAVLNLCELEDPYRVEFHKWEPIPDAEPAPSLQWLRSQVEFIQAQRTAGRTVFIHCKQGISRSSMVLAAYLMQREGWSRDEALAFLRSHRPGVRPNPAFMQLLLEWEQSLKV